jgi:hypothetical protein
VGFANEDLVSADVEKIQKKKASQAFLVWVLFFAATVSINLLIPFALRIDLHAWTYSNQKGLILFSVNNAGFFLVLPLLLAKGWSTVRKPSFLIPLTAAAVSVVVWYPLRYIATVTIVVYVYLHWRFDLSELGFKSKGRMGDLAAIILVGCLGLIQAFTTSNTLQLAVLPAFYSALFRMFGNPASTVENLFYFGFLTERLANRWNRYLLPFLVGVMYTMHEISNPEYWYEGYSFVAIFIGVTVFAAVYLWRRSIVVTWLSDGLRWFIGMLL